MCPDLREYSKFLTGALGHRSCKSNQRSACSSTSALICFRRLEGVLLEVRYLISSYVISVGRKKYSVRTFRAVASFRKVSERGMFLLCSYFFIMLRLTPAWVARFSMESPAAARARRKR